MTTESSAEFWGEPIHIYTRAEALADGVLVDVTETAREAGFYLPTAITAAVSADLAERGDRDGRLWDLLWMGVMAVRKAKAQDRQDRHLRRSRQQDPGGHELVYALIMPVGEETTTG